MALSIPSLGELHERLVADYQARFPSANLSWSSDNWKRTRVLALATWALMHAAQVTYDDLFPDTAEGAALDRLGRIWGVIRKGATPARASNALRVTGTVAAAVAVGDELTHASGQRFQVHGAGVIPAGLFVDVDIVAIDVGSSTRLNAGEELTFASPPAGINAAAELQLALDQDGVDAESDGEYRVRLLDRIAQPGMGGNANDYRTWALEVTGIASAYVYPLRRGRGSVDLAALHAGSGTVRLLTSGERAELLAYLADLRPVSKKSFRVLEVTTTEVDVDLRVKPRPGAEWAFDWDDSGGPLEVAAWTAGTRTLQFTAARPGDMAEGHRLVLKTAAGNGSGAPLEIESLSSTDSVVITADTVPTVAPVATDDVYAGGNLTAAVRAALLAQLDALGPAVGDYGTGEWDSDVKPQRLEAAALAVEGTRDVECVTPAAAVLADDPVFPNDTTVELLIPGEIVVRSLS